jgi:16S rRNA (cytosine967-C5)-methyltransferase
MREVQISSAQAVQQVLGGRNLDRALQAALRDCTLISSERAAVQALAYGTLRQLGYVRFALAYLAPRPQKNPALAALLWVALHQLERSEAAAYAVVDSAVDNAAAIGGKALKPFVNAVLRSYLRRRDEIRDAAALDDEARFSYPAWWIDKVRGQLGKHAESVLESGNLHPPMTLRVNCRRIDLPAYEVLLRQSSIASRPLGPQALCLEKPLPVGRLPGFAAGLVSVQDAGAQRAAALLDPQPGARVLDACAAPGGKTAHLLERAELDLTALDSDPQRSARIVDNLQRLGLAARVLTADAGVLDAWWDGRPFDRILADVPCSASGVVRRHPDIKWLRRPGDIDNFIREQRRILDSLWKVLAPGGKLLYVTCSIFSEENQDQVAAFLLRHADARHPEQPGAGLLLPTHEHDGFYYALIEKA